MNLLKEKRPCRSCKEPNEYLVPLSGCRCSDCVYAARKSLERGRDSNTSAQATAQPGAPERPAEIPESTPFSLSETFLECRPDGVVQVKDGRSLEEYINDPRFVARRKKQIKSTKPMVLCDAEVFGMAAIPHCA